MLQTFMKCKFMHMYFEHIHTWFVAFKKLQVLLTSWRLFLFQVSAFLLEFMFWKAKSRENKVWSKFRQEYLLHFLSSGSNHMSPKVCLYITNSGWHISQQVCKPKSEALKHLLKELDNVNLSSTAM